MTACIAALAFITVITADFIPMRRTGSKRDVSVYCVIIALAALMTALYVFEAPLPGIFGGVG